MSLHRIAVLASLAVAACAGPGGYQLTAEVHSLPPGPGSSGGLSKVAGAKVEVLCPGGEVRELGSTDGSGSLHAEGTGTIPLACQVAVGRPGGKQVRYSVADLCLEENTDGCRALALRATLASEGAGGDAR